MTPPPDDHECGWRTHAEMVAAKLEAITAELDALKRHVHGKKSERRNASKLPPPVSPAKPSSEATHAKRRAAAELRNARIETTEEEVPVPADKRSCPVCDATEMPRMGTGKESAVIDYVAGYFRRKRFLREVLACRCGQHIVTAPAPTASARARATRPVSSRTSWCRVPRRVGQGPHRASRTMRSSAENRQAWGPRRKSDGYCGLEQEIGKRGSQGGTRTGTGRPSTLRQRCGVGSA